LTTIKDLLQTPLDEIEIDTNNDPMITSKQT